MRRGAIAKVVLWGTVAALSVIGVWSALSRAFDLATTLASADPRSVAPSPREQMLLDQTAMLMGVEKGSEKYREALAGSVAFNTTYVSHPVVTFLHVLPGALILTLAPLQFSRRIRRNIRFHRWAGRILLVAALVAAYSAFFFGLRMPYGGAGEAAATVVFGGLFVFAGARAYVAIRRGDIARHREWMIRMFAIAIGVSTIRLLFPVVAATSSATFPQQFALTLWIGWTSTLAAAEAWIRHGRR